MKKVVLGKPLNPSVFESRHKWLLHSMNEIELASAVRDPELDAIDAKLDAIEARLDATDASLDARLDAIEARLDALEAGP